MDALNFYLGELKNKLALKFEYWLRFYHAEELLEPELRKIILESLVDAVATLRDTITHDEMDVLMKNALLTNGVEIKESEEIERKGDKIMLRYFKELEKLLPELENYSLEESGLTEEQVNYRGHQINITEKQLLNYTHKNYPDIIPFGEKWFKIQAEFIKHRKKIIDNSGEKKNKQLKTDNINELVLYDIWLPDNKGSKESYYKIIEKLQSHIILRDKDIKLVDDFQGKLYWNKSRGGIKYLQGFIVIMLEKKWLKNEYSAREWIKILSNTFNISANIDDKPFKPSSLRRDALNETYLTLFEKLESNK